MINYEDLIKKELEHIQKIPVDRVSFLVEMLFNSDPKSRIITTGMGKAGQIAHTLATTLCSTGSPAYFLHPAEAQHGDLGMVGKHDRIIAFSNSGKTREVIETLKLCRQMHPKKMDSWGTNENYIVSIIGSSDGVEEITELSDAVLNYGPVEEICPLGLTPTTSTTCMSVICDLLVCGLIEYNNFTKEEYAIRHHSGYLNIKATSNE
jgi:arabinose-5-phosphate isomerase